MPPFDPAAFQMPCGHFIGGRVVEAPDSLTVHRPSDGRPHAALPLADASTVDAAVRDADTAHRRSDWARRAPRERARVLRRWADLVEADVEFLAPLEAVCSVGAALAAGNAVVLKPSELTPYSVLRLAELAVEAGVPPGIFNVVQGDGRMAGDALTRHPLVKRMTFTGSTATGSAIMASCANHGPKPATLELGGKSPQLVFDDVPNVERLAGIVARAITGNAGQVCVAGSRLIVQRRVAAELVERIASHFTAHRPTDRFRARGARMRCVAHAIWAHRTACCARPAKRQLRSGAGCNSRYAHGGTVMQ